MSDTTMQANSGSSADPGSQQRAFACHFFKFDSYTYGKCATRHYATIADLKTHIRKHHTLPHCCCTTCWRSFQDMKSLCNHMNEKNCQNREQPQELLAEEFKNLGRCRGATPKEKWHILWNEIFVNRPAPSSPYYEPNVAKAIIDEFRTHPAGATHVFPSSLLPNIDDVNWTAAINSAIDTRCDLFCRPQSRHQPHSDSSSNAAPEPSLWDEDGFGLDLELISRANAIPDGRYGPEHGI